MTIATTKEKPNTAFGDGQSLEARHPTMNASILDLIWRRTYFR
jgi:hypothetical protein